MGRNTKSVDITKFTLKELTGVEEDDISVQPDDSDEAAACFERRKKQIREKINSDVFTFSELILE